MEVEGDSINLHSNHSAVNQEQIIFLPKYISSQTQQYNKGVHLLYWWLADHIQASKTISYHTCLHNECRKYFEGIGCKKYFWMAIKPLPHLKFPNVYRTIKLFTSNVQQYILVRVHSIIS